MLIPIEFQAPFRLAALILVLRDRLPRQSARWGIQARRWAEYSRKQASPKRPRFAMMVLAALALPRGHALKAGAIDV